VLASAAQVRVPAHLPRTVALQCSALQATPRAAAAQCMQ